MLEMEDHDLSMDCKDYLKSRMRENRTYGSVSNAIKLRDF